MIRRACALLNHYLFGSPAKSSQDFAKDIEDELTFHLEQRTQHLIDEGHPVEEAKSEAIGRFGDPGRIARECQAVSLTGFTWMHRVHLTMTCVLGIVVTILLIDSLAQRTRLRAIPTGIATMLDDDWSGDIHGTVQDELGRPIANADVLLAVKAWPDGSFFQRAYATRTLPDGSFVFENVRPADAMYDVQLSVVAPQQEIKSQYASFLDGQSRPFQFELASANDFVVEVRGQQGQLLSHAQIFPHQRVSKDGNSHLIYYDTAEPIMQTTGADGRVRVAGCQPGDAMVLMVEDADDDWKSVEVTVPDGDGVLQIQLDS